VPPRRSRTPRSLVLAAVAACLLAAWFVSGLGQDGGGSRPDDARPPAGGVPAPLDDALSDLEEILR
jgi:hypothetical protein